MSIFNFEISPKSEKFSSTIHQHQLQILLKFIKINVTFEKPCIFKELLTRITDNKTSFSKNNNK